MNRRTTILGAAVGVVVIAVIQLVPVERTNPPVESEVDAPGEVMSVLRRACYDCHSNTTNWPWYSRLAPVSWLLADHVRDGRGDLNFSEWPVFNLEEQQRVLGDIEREVSEGRMPLRSYRLLHRGARLSDAERGILLRWARSLSEDPAG